MTFHPGPFFTPHSPTVTVHVAGAGTSWWTIFAAVIVGFGAAALGGWMQRNAALTAVQLQNQIDAAAKFLGTVGDFQFAYGSAWEPDTTDLTLTERQRPIFAVVLALRAQAAAVEIVGPDELGDIASWIVRLAADRGLATSLDPPLGGDLALGVERFEHEARALRVGKKTNGPLERVRRKRTAGM
jgi:hypothetical protein